MNEETPDLPAEHKAKLLRDLLDFYQRHPLTTDLAIESALKLAGSAEEAGQVERLEAALRNDRAALDGEAARELLRNPALQPVVASAQAEGVAGVSVGMSLGLSLLVGAAAGGDALVNVDDNSACFRGWGVVGAGIDVFAGIGLNIGIWDTLPVLDRKTFIAGVVTDLPIAGKAVIRFMSVMVGPAFDASISEFTLVGVTVAINFGRGAGFMHYRGVEFAAGIPPRRAKLTVCNCTNGSNPCKPGTSSIGQNVSSILDFTLENTSGKPITIAPGDEMIISMPSYFSSSDLTAIKVTPPSGWSSLGWGANDNLTLQYKGASTLSWSAPLTFALASAKPSQATPTEGKVTVKIPSAKVEGATLDKDGVVASASLTLVPSIMYALITNWSSIHPDFTLVSGSTDFGKNVTATSQPNPNTVTTLGQVVDSKGQVWNLGYQFYVDSSLLPCFRACWYQDGKFVQDGKTLFAPNVITVTASPAISTAYFNNNQGNPNTLTINVQLSA